MADKFGIRVAQKEYSADNAADYQLLFTSEWPLLKIEKQGSVTIADKSQDVTIATHDLGYAPMFLVYAVGGLFGDMGTNTVLLTGYPARISATDLKWFGSYDGVSSGAITIYYYIFRYPMTQNYTADILSQSAASPESGGDQGFKMAMDGKTAKSTDLRDFVVHTDARNLQIQKSFNKLFTGTGWTENIPHGLTYEPFFLFYMKDTYGYGGGTILNYWELVGAGDQERKAYADTSYVRCTAIPKGEIFVAIFKDPYALAE